MTGSEIEFQIVHSSPFLPLVQLYADSRIIRSISFSNVANARIYIKNVQLEIKIRNSDFVYLDTDKISVNLDGICFGQNRANNDIENYRIIRHVCGGGRKKVGI